MKSTTATKMKTNIRLRPTQNQNPPSIFRGTNNNDLKAQANNPSALYESSGPALISEQSRIFQDSRLPHSKRWISLRIINDVWPIGYPPVDACSESTARAIISKNSRVFQDSERSRPERLASLGIINSVWQIRHFQVDACPESTAQAIISKHSRVCQDNKRPCFERRASLRIINQAWQSEYREANVNNTKTVCIDTSKNETKIFVTKTNDALKVDDNITGKWFGINVKEEEDKPDDSATDLTTLYSLDGDDVDSLAITLEEGGKSTGEEEMDNEESSCASSVRLELDTQDDSSDDNSWDGDKDNESYLSSSDEDNEARISDVDDEGAGGGREAVDDANRVGVDSDGEGQAGVSNATGCAGVLSSNTTDRAEMPEPNATDRTRVDEPPEVIRSEDDDDQAPEPHVLLLEQSLTVGGNCSLTLLAHDTPLVPVLRSSPTERHNIVETNHVDFGPFNDEEDPQDLDENEQEIDQYQVTMATIPLRPVALRRSKRLMQQEPDELLGSQTTTDAVDPSRNLPRRSTRIRRKPDYYTPCWD